MGDTMGEVNGNYIAPNYWYCQLVLIGILVILSFGVFALRKFKLFNQTRDSDSTYFVTLRA